MSTPKRPLSQAFQEKRNVMVAVMLRDMRSRFFNHGIGFLMVPLWPLTHMILLLIIYNVLGRQTPYGSSLNVFFATGLVPTLTFMYVSRFMAVSLLNNRNMLSFPIVKALDIVMARAFLEFAGCCLTVCFLFALMLSLGENPYPVDPFEATGAFLTALTMAIGMGMLVSVIVMFFRGFLTMYFLLMLVVYISSGTLFVASNFPDSIAIPLSYNPILQCVEWMRAAYYPGYNDRLLDRQYVVQIAGLCVCAGLVVERLTRRLVYES
ncbi:capsular polysaccharide transport system permease protein [Rhizobium sp. RAS22]|nr:capsular polysaccharide transport system permease protein [Rhizobium sp. RAS22]